MNLGDIPSVALALRQLADFVEEGKVYLISVRQDYETQTHHPWHGPPIVEDMATRVTLELLGPPAIFEETVGDRRTLSPPEPRKITDAR